MATEDAELIRIRQAIADRGLSQKKVADMIGLPQSAVSNLLKGKRRLKVGELLQLHSILEISEPVSDRLEPIPLISGIEIDNFDEASKRSKANLPGLMRPTGSRQFAFLGLEHRLSVERFREYYCVVDPDELALTANSAYLIDEGSRYLSLVTYHNDPPRFENLWNPEWDGGPRLIGSFPFSIIGAIRQFGWRHDFPSENQIDRMIRKSD